MLLQKSWSNKKCPKSNINPALDAQKSLKKLFWACFGQKTSFLGVFAKMPNWNQHLWIAKLAKKNLEQILVWTLMKMLMNLDVEQLLDQFRTIFGQIQVGTLYQITVPDHCYLNIYETWCKTRVAFHFTIPPNVAKRNFIKIHFLHKGIKQNSSYV